MISPKESDPRVIGVEVGVAAPTDASELADLFARRVQAYHELLRMHYIGLFGFAPNNDVKIHALSSEEDGTLPLQLADPENQQRFISAGSLPLPKVETNGDPEAPHRRTLSKSGGHIAEDPVQAGTIWSAVMGFD